MTLLIAALIALAVFAAGYNLFYRRWLAAARAGERLSAAQQPPTAGTGIDPKSPAYRLAAAGLPGTNARVVLFVLEWALPLVAGLALGVSRFPPLIVLAAAALTAIAVRRWLADRARSRGKRIDAELPMAYVRLLASLQANPDIGRALADTASTLEIERGPTPLSHELQRTAAEAQDASLGRDAALQRLQARAASVSLANLGLLLARFAQAGQAGDSYYQAFEQAAVNVQGILAARSRAQARAAEQLQAARVIPLLMGGALLFFMNDPQFASGLQLPVIQLILAGAGGMMFVGYTVMADITREAV